MKIVITGASKGIGSKILNYLSKNNDVIGIARRKISKSKIKFYFCDVQKFNKLKLIFKKIGNFDVLINCAGISNYSKYPIKNFDTIIKTNLNGAYYTSTAALKYLKFSKNSSIINIGSINAYLAFPNNPGYVSSKGGLLSLTKSLEYDYAKFNIRVNSVSPGYIKEGMTMKSYNNLNLRKKRTERTMLNRWGQTEDLFGILDYLINDRSSYVTAQDFVIDGGWLYKGL